MTTQEFEEALNATNTSYVIDEIIKPEGAVLRVKGHVPWGDGYRKVIWHSNGECFSPKGTRFPQFDLIIKSLEVISKQALT